MYCVSSEGKHGCILRKGESKLVNCNLELNVLCYYYAIGCFLLQKQVPVQYLTGFSWIQLVTNNFISICRSQYFVIINLEMVIKLITIKGCSRHQIEKSVIIIVKLLTFWIDLLLMKSWLFLILHYLLQIPRRLNID